MGFYLQGLTMGLAYVAPIGMQNLFVINSALTKTRRKAVLTALVVIVFDILLSLACFFGIGALIQRYDGLRLGVLAVGGLVVLRIGAGLLFPRFFRKGETSDGESSDGESFGRRRGDGTGDGGWWKTVSTACVVTWCNPQAIVDGTLMLGAFAATLNARDSAPFITGVQTASVLWFLTITLLVNAFAHKFNDRIIETLNRVCGAVIILYGLKLLADFALAVL